MNTENIVSIEIPEENLKKAEQGLQMLQEALSPFLLALSPKQRQTIPTLGKNSEAFVTKIMSYTKSSTHLCPPYLELTEMEKDWVALKQMQPILRGVNQLQSNLNDTVLLAGSELYLSSLTFYKSVKQAAKMNVLEAKPIYEDLKFRFENQGKRKTESPT